jgi:hypothetical protein
MPFLEKAPIAEILNDYMRHTRELELAETAPVAQ